MTQPMTKVGVADLKAKLSEYLRIVRKGGEVVVMDRDQPVARIVPYSETGGLRIREPLARYKRLGDIPLPPPAKLDIDPAELLIEERNRDR